MVITRAGGLHLDVFVADTVLDNRGNGGFTVGGEEEVFLGDALLVAAGTIGDNEAHRLVALAEFVLRDGVDGTVGRVEPVVLEFLLLVRAGALGRLDLQLFVALAELIRGLAVRLVLPVLPVLVPVFFTGALGTKHLRGHVLEALALLFGRGGTVGGELTLVLGLLLLAFTRAGFL